MHESQLSMNLSSALQQLESVKAAVDQSNDPKLKAATNDDLNMLLSLLECPILKSIATLHDSISMLSTQVTQHPSILPNDFDITPAGDLVLHTRNLFVGHEGEEEQRVPQVSPPQSLEFGSDNERMIDNASVNSSLSPRQTRGLLDLTTRNDDSLPSTSHNIVPSDWAQVEIINLVNDGTGLGFGIIGARTSGVIVKTILAGGVADRDGRLRSGDHILQIGDVSLLEMGSEQVAGVLRASGTRVRLVVARAADPAAPVAPSADPAPCVPARLLSDPEALDRYLLEAGFEQVFNTQPTPTVPHSNSRFVFDRSITPPIDEDADSPEVDRFTVQLRKDENGLGITIAGYVCEKEELSGIFVKSVTPGSAAALSGKVRVNDRIVAVDGVSLAGKSNQRAVDALKQSGNLVTLELERYLRGPKYEQLQQAIAAGEAGEMQPHVPAPHNPFLHMHRADGNGAHDIPMSHFVPSESTSVDEPEVRPGSSTAVDSWSQSVSHKTRPQPPFEMPRTPEQKEAIRRKWQAILGDDVEIVVGIVVRGGGGLGISLEGTVDVERGREVRPHHYVRSVLPEGPVGRAQIHRTGDELLEVNGHRLLGMNHLEVVSILKELSSEVCMVCARPLPPPPPPPIDLAPPPSTLVKAKSDGSLAGAGIDEPNALNNSSKVRSRSLEPLTGLAMWSSEPQIIELVKGERGLGFSILDYQDPLRPSHTLVVIRSLVPGGVAQQDGRLIPGDRLLFVNEQNLENASLEQAVAALKGAPRGIVRIGVAKPLPLADAPIHTNTNAD